MIFPTQTRFSTPLSPAAIMSMCFDEAYQALKTNRISEQEYMHEVLAHFVGVRHPADEKLTRPWELMISDPVGNAIRDAALSSPTTKPECINQLEDLFASTLVDDATAVQAIAAQLAAAAGQPLPIQAIATFAAFHSDVEVLRLCTQMGASLDDRNTSMALEYAARGPALLDLLYEKNWRYMRESTQSFNRMLEWSLHTGSQELVWFLDRGAKVDKDIIRRAVHGPPVKVACIEVLLHRFGVDLFKGTRLLQTAAKRGCNELVKLLLDAGVDVDDMSTRAHHDEGECECTALYEAVYKQHEDTILLLLAHGANPNKQVCDDGLNTPLKLAEGHDYVRIVGLLRRSIERKQVGNRSYTSRL